MMTTAEVDLLDRYLKQSTNYVEFGSGGSTSLALRNDISQITSVESSAEWLTKIREQPEIAAAETAGRLRFVQVDIGPTKEFGYPIDEQKARAWPSYYGGVWRMVNPTSIDTVLIDGRFRVSCALSAMMYCGTATRIIFHDFWDRPFYGSVLYFSRVVERVERMAVLELLPIVDWRSFAVALQVHAMDPR